jgi:hypothetical protein
MALPTGIKRLALVTAGAPLVAAMATVMFASPSLAASQSAKAAVTAQASSDHVYSTLVHGLHVRKKPATAATTVAVLGPAGSEVVVNCYAFGTSVFGDSVWYHIVKPLSGFVTGFYLDTGHDPAPGIRHCCPPRPAGTGKCQPSRCTALRLGATRRSPTRRSPGCYRLGAYSVR